MQKQIIHLIRKDCYKKYTFFNNLGNISNVDCRIGSLEI